eukprot:scaffold1954_cov268-Pinguiococcus_pyrenoidosus.AAC.229
MEPSRPRSSYPNVIEPPKGRLQQIFEEHSYNCEFHPVKAHWNAAVGATACGLALSVGRGAAFMLTVPSGLRLRGFLFAARSTGADEAGDTRVAEPRTPDHAAGCSASLLHSVPARDSLSWTTQRLQGHSCDLLQQGLAHAPTELTQWQLSCPFNRVLLSSPSHQRSSAYSARHFLVLETWRTSAEARRSALLQAGLDIPGAPWLRRILPGAPFSAICKWHEKEPSDYANAHIICNSLLSRWAGAE